jgi:hypothetical protein
MSDAVTRQQRRAAERAARKRCIAEVVIYDETAEALADLFLPPEGTFVPAEELRAACLRLMEATRALKRLDRARVES